MKKFLAIILCIVVVMVLSFCVYNAYTNDTTETPDATAETTISDTTSTVPDFCRTPFDNSYFSNLT